MAALRSWHWTSAHGSPSLWLGLWIWEQNYDSSHSRTWDDMHFEDLRIYVYINIVIYIYIYIHTCIMYHVCVYIYTVYTCMYVRTYLHTYIHYITLHDITYHTIPYHSIPLHTIPYHYCTYHSIPYYTIPFHTIHTHIRWSSWIFPTIYINPLTLGDAATSSARGASARKPPTSSVSPVYSSWDRWGLVLSHRKIPKWLKKRRLITQN